MMQKTPRGGTFHPKILKLISFFKRFYLFIFRERGRKGEREEEKHHRAVASCAPSTTDLAVNPGMNQTEDHSVCMLALTPLRHISQWLKLIS